MKATLPKDEEQRLEVLHSYDVLDTPPEPEFDDITLLAAQICGTPISIVTLLDENRQWFKSKVGIGAAETARDIAFCSYTILRDELLLVSDATKDERFADNPLVTSDPSIRFYAGMPLATQEGQNLGSLCVVDTVPRQLDAGQIEALRVLSKQVTALLERRRALSEARKLQRFFHSTLDALPTHIAVLDAKGEIVSVNEAWSRFAAENNGFTGTTGVGVNYLEVCERISGEGAQEARQMVQGLRDVLSGKTAKYCLEYPCHSVSELRWFNLSVTRFEDGGPVYVVVAHENITERKLAELELAAREAKFSAIFDSVQDAILLHGNDGIYVDANPAACRILGRSREEIIHRRAQDLVATSMQPKISELREEFRRQGQQTGELEFARPDGSNRVLEYQAVANFLPGQHLSVLRDITERKQAEENQMRLAAIVESSRDGIMGKSLDGIVVSWNKAAERLYGYSAPEIIGRPVSILVPPERAGEEKRLMEAHKQGEHVANFETVRLNKNGEQIPISLTSSPWLDARGNIIGASEISRDITQQKQAEEVQARLAAIVKNSSDAIISKTLDGIITTWNRGAEQIYGYTAAEAIGRPMSVLLPPDLLHEETEILAKLQQGEHIVPFETRRVRKNGHQIDVAVASSPIVDASSNTIGGASIARDISERKQAEVERERFFALSLDLLCIVDGQGTFLRVNPAFKRILGYSPETMMGQSVFQYLHPADHASSMEALEQLAAGIPVVNYINRWLCRDGSYKSVLWATAPYGEQFYAAGRDITDIMAAEAEREQSLALLNATLESTADGILVVNNHGQVTHWNLQFLSMWRIPDEIVETKNNDRVIAFVKHQLIDPEAFESSTYELLADTRREGYDLLYFTDGRVFERYSKTKQVSESSIERVWSFRDITERQRAIEQQAQLNSELESQRRRLDDILANVPGIVWENAVDPTTLVQSVIYVSQYVETMLGYSTDEWCNTPKFWFTALHPDDRERVFAESDVIVRHRKSGVLRYRFVAKDGHVIWVETHCAVEHNEQGLPLVLRGVTMDITERIQAQEEQSRLAALLDSTTDLVGWADLKGNIRYINPAGRTMLGLSQNESVEESNISDFVSESSHDLLLNTGLSTAAQQGSWQGEHALMSRDGREIPISQVVTAHKDVNGNVSYYSTVARDISESRRVRAILERANEELEERVVERTAELAQTNNELQTQIAERQMAMGALHEAVQTLEESRKDAEAARLEAERANRAKSEFLSRMSHELRTPLNAILGFGQILQRRSLGPRENVAVEQIVKAGRHLLQLINEVLEISRIEAGHLSLSIETVEVLPLLSEVINLVQPMAMQRSLSLNMGAQAAQATAGGCFVKADRQRLQQVMLNLLSNAIKYNREGGNVTVSLQIVLGTDASPEAWRIEVRDTGPGIAVEDQEKIFLPFERLGAENTKTEGTGIGLTLTKHLVEQMQGQIGVESLLGQGTAFWFELPMERNPFPMLHGRQTESPSSRPSLISSRGRYTVLYIEDNASNLSVMEALMNEIPQVRLLTAIQGSIGLDLVRQYHPNLVLLDLHLPDIGGDKVLRRIQADSATQDIPVVMISADATANQISNLLAAGARNYLTKPLEIEQLLRVLEEVFWEND